MAKPLYFKNPAKAPIKQNFIFMAVEKPSAQPTGGGPATVSLAERLEKKLNTSLNVDTAFTPDFNAVLDNLGTKAHEKNPAVTAESIRQNFNDTLAPGKTPDNAWAYLQNNNCETAAIIDGRLRFFAGPIGGKEILLTDFFKPMEMKIGGEGTLTNEYLLRKQEMMIQTSQALATLKGELPELPPNKIS